MCWRQFITQLLSKESEALCKHSTKTIVGEHARIEAHVDIASAHLRLPAQRTRRYGARSAFRGTSRRSCSNPCHGERFTYSLTKGTACSRLFEGQGWTILDDRRRSGSFVRAGGLGGGLRLGEFPGFSMSPPRQPHEGACRSGDGCAACGEGLRTPPHTPPAAR